jgi:DNA repair protein RecO (recombination protein O)
LLATLSRKVASEDLAPMKRHKTEAIVLHTYPVRERDKLVVFLTPEEGKLRGWAYGARSIKSRFGAALEPLAKVRISYSMRPNDEVVRIETIDLVRSLFPAQQNLVGSVAGTYLAESADTFAQAGEESDLFFRLLDRTSDALLAGHHPTSVVTYAEVWILKIAGVLPSIRNCIECNSALRKPLRYAPDRNGFVCERCSGAIDLIVPNEISDALSDIMRLPVEEFAARSSSRPDVLFEIRSFVRSLRRNFLGHELKSHDILQTVLPA